MPKIPQFSLLFAFLLALHAPTQAIEKCESAGKTTYGDTSCVDGKAQTINPAGNPSASDAMQARRRAMQEKGDAKHLADARHKRDAKEEAAQRQAARADASKQKKCRALAQRVKWSSEDAASASSRSSERLKRKAHRIAEKQQAECGS